MTRLEDLLGDELGRRAESVTDAPLTVAAVTGTARSIRRRRTALVAGVAALVLAAVAVPVALTRTGDRAAPPIAQDVPRLPLDYLAGGVVHLTDGTTVTPQLDLRPAAPFAHLADGRFVFVTADDEGRRWQAAVTSADGSPVAAYPMTSSLVVDQHDTAVAWVAPDGTPTVLQAGRDEPVTLAGLPGRRATPVALLGGDCTVADGCTLVANTSRGAYAVTPSAQPVAFTGPDGRAVSGVSPDGLEDAEWDHETSDFESCQSLWRHDAGGYAEKTCRYGYLSYSPDGALLRAAPAMTDGYGPSALYLLDHSSLVKPLASTPEGAGTFFDDAFVDPETVAALLDDGHGNAVLVELDVSGDYRRLGRIGSISMDEQRRTVFLQQRW